METIIGGETPRDIYNFFWGGVRKKCVCGMNVYECVCESVSEWNECDMRMYESVCVW